MFENQNIGFIGGGNMGEALIRGLLASALFPADRISVYDVSSSRIEYLIKEYGVRTSRNMAELAAPSGILVLAIKPQTMSAVLNELRSHVSHRPLVISIAAGIPLSMLEGYLPEGIATVRVMPNTPALVLKGASALSRGKTVTSEQMEMSLALFRAVGKAVEVEEKWMDTVTGLSGSSPAFVLLMIEALIDSGVLMGLPRHLSRELAVQTVLGTALMLDQTGRHPAELREMITSPGGTTIHGLKVLEAKAVRGALMEAVEAATRRSEELGKG
jgi:pyrroline-5-carboxylate reductase